MKKREKEFVVKILKAEWVAHDVRRFNVEKPEGFSFIILRAVSKNLLCDGIFYPPLDISYAFFFF